MRIKKGDTVKVLSGNDKDKTGEVLEVLPKQDKVIVKEVNIRKKHTKARKAGEEDNKRRKEEINPFKGWRESKAIA